MGFFSFLKKVVTSTAAFVSKAISRTASFAAKVISNTASYVAKAISNTASYVARAVSNTASYISRSIDRTASWLSTRIQRVFSRKDRPGHVEHNQSPPPAVEKEKPDITYLENVESRVFESVQSDFLNLWRGTKPIIQDMHLVRSSTRISEAYLRHFNTLGDSREHCYAFYTGSHPCNIATTGSTTLCTRSDCEICTAMSNRFKNFFDSARSRDKSGEIFMDRNPRTADQKSSSLEKNRLMLMCEVTFDSADLYKVLEQSPGEVLLESPDGIIPLYLIVYSN